MFTLGLVFIAAKFKLTFEILYFGMFIIDLVFFETISNYFKYKSSKNASNKSETKEN